MIARFDHRPMLTVLLALTTTVLLVGVVTLSTLLITAAPPAAPALSGSVGENPPAVVSSEHYGDDWSNYGHDFDQPKPAQIGNGADLSAIDRHREIVEAYTK